MEPGEKRDSVNLIFQSGKERSFLVYSGKILIKKRRLKRKLRLSAWKVGLFSMQIVDFLKWLLDIADHVISRLYLPLLQNFLIYHK
jgi:hypothetical protein